ncbi:hypothetical protein KCP75_22325 [Salmonella enterica subsp. enterica]|nr:hypothetical protein KCP75_22325 [Salmonella enterica subsp. enterica]
MFLNLFEAAGENSGIIGSSGGNPSTLRGGAGCRPPCENLSAVWRLHVNAWLRVQFIAAEASMGRERIFWYQFCAFQPETNNKTIWRSQLNFRCVHLLVESDRQMPLSRRSDDDG